MVEFTVDRMRTNPEFCATIHRAIGCCQDGRCTKTSPNHAPLTLSDFEEAA